MPNPRPGLVAVVALAATYLFWFEYLPPFKQVRLYSDIEGFHWPLLVAAFEAIRHGRFPLWDASIYCGIPFAGNIQAGVLYPPTWLLFAANLRSGHVLFKTLEAWVFLHGWLAFFLCYLWLRGRRLSLLASALGASVFAFGGYMVSQNNHIGVVAGYAWTPLAWLGIDQAHVDQTHDARSWRPLWKVIAASALCFLAGYTLSFSAFAIATIVYATARSWRLGLASVGAIAVSLAVAAVQLLPAAEAASLKTFDPKYGPGIWDPTFYLQFVVPDWLGFKFGDPYLYLYLGVPALFGIPWLIKRPDRAAIAVLAACALFLTNPFGILSNLLSRSTLLVQAFYPLNFVEPATLVFAFIAANGVDGFLQSAKRPNMGWLSRRAFVFSTALLLALWSVYRLWIWPRPVTGWRSLGEACVMLALFIAGLVAIPQGRAWVAVALCAAVFVDFKVGGTSRVFSATPGDVDRVYTRGIFPGVDTQAFDTLRANRQYRVAVDGLHPTELRRYGLATPQGFDAMLPAQYKAFIERYKPFSTNRLFDIRPSDKELLQILGVRYFLTREEASFRPEVESNPDFHLVGSRDAFYQVYEYAKAAPPWRWQGTGEANPTRWEPELREFRVNASTAGRFVLVEQYYPGWRASVDGVLVPIERWDSVFQSIPVPAGSHIVMFEYRPSSVRIGAAISASTLVGLAIWLWRRPAPPVRGGVSAPDAH